jgi:hypothetical protein
MKSDMGEAIKGKLKGKFKGKHEPTIIRVQSPANRSKFAANSPQTPAWSHGVKRQKAWRFARKTGAKDASESPLGAQFPTIDKRLAERLVHLALSCDRVFG